MLLRLLPPFLWASAGSLAFLGTPPHCLPSPPRLIYPAHASSADVSAAVEADVVYDVPRGLEDGTASRRKKRTWDDDAAGGDGGGGGWRGRTLFNRRAEDVQEDIEKLAKEIVQVVREAGPRVGVRRSLQATRAIISTSWDVMREVGRRRIQSRSSTSEEEEEGDQKGIQGADTARFLRVLFERLGATYIKLGQFIASSPTLFPAAFVMEFQQCLDCTEPVPFSVINRIIRSELGAETVSNSFQYIDPIPIASASIAQVHRAKLTTGEEVVIKVQKPGVDATLKADLGFIYISSRIIELLQPELARTSFSAIVGDIRGSMLEELDFTKEANNIDEFRDFLVKADIAEATAPRVFRNLSRKRVLVMERLYGVPLTDLEGIRSFSANPELTLITALNTWSMSVMMCKSFHGDLHAGNLLVLEDGRVGFIDFGIVGRVPKSIWGALSSLSNGFVTGNFKLMAESLVKMGATDGEVDIDRFADDIEAIFRRLARMESDVSISATNTVSGRVGVATSVSIDQDEVTKLLIDIVGTAEDNGLKLPREFGLLIKQALYLDRYASILAPDMNVLDDSRVKLPNSSYQ